MAVAVGVAAMLGSRLAGRAGYKWPMVGGPLIAAAGLALLAGMGAGGAYLGDVLPGFLVTGAGVGMTMVAATIAATGAAPPEEEGLTSALLTAAQQLGFALGYAILAGVASSATASSSQATPMVRADRSGARLPLSVPRGRRGRGRLLAVRFGLRPLAAW